MTIPFNLWGEPALKKGRFGVLYTNEQAFDDDNSGQQIKADYGYKYQKLSRADISSLDPHISDRYNVATVFNDHAWITDPAQYLRTIFEYYIAKGGKFLKSEVKGIDNRAITLKNNEVLTADKIVIATGAWSNYLANKLGVNSKIESERGYHFAACILRNTFN